MTGTEQKLYKQLVDKSTEAFTMAIEIYNKPTLKYRVEGFAFFICNAWELMLKAYLIKTQGESSIYYSDKDSRSISLRDCITKILTNEKDPLRKNLECLVELRNTSTHFILPEYEILYAPLFQACVMNYIQKLYQYHELDISKTLPDRFITLSISNSSFSDEEIRAKYGEKLSAHLLELCESLESMTNDNHSPSFSIKIKHELQLTKSKDGTPIRWANEDEDAESVRIITKLSDVNSSFPYNVKAIIDKVRKQLLKLHISTKFNSSTFNDMCQYFGWKTNPKLSYAHKIDKQPRYTYSQQLIEQIINQYKEDPNCGERIHKEMEARRKENKKK